jgi:hypothetical protein
MSTKTTIDKMKRAVVRALGTLRIVFEGVATVGDARKT